ncbi:MAG: hypothetical protein AB1782_10385 [Cyanobacteriota bacterium]
MINFNANKIVPFKGQMEISAGKEINLKTPTNESTDKQFLQPFERMFKENPDSLKLAAGEDSFYTKVGDGAIFCTNKDDNITISTSNIMPFPFFNFKLTMNSQNTGFRVFNQAQELCDKILTTLKARYKE